ncbi:hypothetical protein [Roseivivax sediminis]|uniref:Uncharacterized protein n=1 Tax=Roseivivax sediminis TaxID=936889 RepID=A0A1I2E1I9_9RHOB|nr:hypothetical protein [Roseivivax sediminis]SFE86473.1 hypothetical protein SAMN04515678_1202 [Roseivivax sediminis]
MDMHLYEVGREDGLREAHARSDEAPADLMSLAVVLGVVGVIAFPWLYPVYWVGDVLSSTGFHLVGVIAILAVVLAANVWLLLEIFRRVPSLILGAVGAVQGGYLAYRELHLIEDATWMILGVILGAIAGMALFVNVASWAKQKRVRRAASV